MRRLILMFLSLILITQSPTGHAQSSSSIAAIVNEDIISIYDLNARISVVIAFSQLPNTAETRKRIATQTLRNLIDERLRTEEATKAQLSVEDADIKRLIVRFEKQNNIPDNQFETYMASRNLDPYSIEDKFKTQILWERFVRAKYARSVNVSDEDINEVLTNIKKNQGKPEYLLAEIFIPVDTPANENEAAEKINGLMKQLQSGASFRGLATNFSQSPMAAVGGDLGWVRTSQLDKKIAATILQLNPGQVTVPIRGSDGYYIVAIRGKRLSKGLTPPPSQPTTLSLFQVHFALPDKATENDTAAIFETAKAMQGRAKSCKELAPLAKKVGSSLSGDLGTVEFGKLSKSLKTLIGKTPAGKMTEPLATPDGVIILMVCDRNDPVVVDPVKKFKQLTRRRLEGKLLEHFARQHLRDLRRTAFVDMRL